MGTKGAGKGGGTLTVDQIEQDRITKLADSYWSFDAKDPLPFNRKIVEELYECEVLKSKYNVKRIMMLEFSQYLENFLWKYYDEKASHWHVMSVVVMVNEKFRERVPAWDCFVAKPEHFSHFFRRVLDALLDSSLQKASLREQTILLVFLAYCFNSLEVDVIRREVQLLIGLPIWSSLLPSLREEILAENPKLKKMWRAFKKQYESLDESERKSRDFLFGFFDKLISRYFEILESFDANETFDKEKLSWLERFVQLIVDCLSLLPTRRFLNTLLSSRHLCIRSRLSQLLKQPEANLLNQLLERLNFYAFFEIDDLSGEPLTDGQVLDIHYDKVGKLQRVAFKHFNEMLADFALANVSSVDERNKLVQYFRKLQPADLRKFSELTHLLPQNDENSSQFSKKLLLEIIVSNSERRKSQIDRLNDMPLYPTEKVIWDTNVVPTEFYSGIECLSLPKLNLQFLSIHDYLLRNFELFRLESTYEIREDIQDALKRIKPYKAENGSVYCGGNARMALPILDFNITYIGKPLLGDTKPSHVRAEFTINIGNMRNDTRHEWESLRRHDVVFFAGINPEKPIGDRFNFENYFPDEFGVKSIRGAEIEGLVMEDGRLYEEGLDQKPVFSNNNRTFRVLLDTAQYQIDQDEMIESKDDIYKGFSIIIRRSAKENNFKAVLDTIRDLMNVKCVVPDWLYDVILGFGDPASALYSNLPNQIEKLDWNDTFLDLAHLKESFPGYNFKIAGKSVHNPPPYRLTIPAGKGFKGNRADYDDEKTLTIESYRPLNRGPYPYSVPKRNQVRFTPKQIEAIRSGSQAGLSLIVGPPGTGKTDVAVQIISNIYHNFPNERTVLVTHSNQALNQLFEKIMALDIDERHLLRLGHGEEMLETEKDFSRYGRVNYVLAKRLELLNEVKRLQDSFGVQGDVAYTCETAGYFYLCEVLRRWEEFLSKTRVNGEKEPSSVCSNFPFTKYFENAPQPLFKEANFYEDMEIAHGCFRHLKSIFTQLEEFRAFELIRNGADRAKYLLVKEAKIIAMTCTHSALKRRDLVQALFQYDNILMEESAQILEIETFIPLLLQNPDRGRSRLKRWIMIGDHHQLPPIIQNMAFQKFSNMEQSLFTRFVRLGVPTIDLDAQGRARSSLCQLYSWRYSNLHNLPHVLARPEFQQANPGFLYDYQLINVPDFEGQGESEPSPHFIQNLAEAEYVVAVFMYMRLIGYPADKISILTTYNGQKQLIRDVLQRRCALNPVFGRPQKIATVDKFQGQQNDYILLSLVRTKQVGHLRDIRRLVVALSRARLGLYVFGRATLFANCYELTPAFNQLSQRSQKLSLLTNEAYPTTRQLDAAPLTPAMVVEDMPTMAHFVYGFYQQRVSQMMAEAEKLAKLEEEKSAVLKEPKSRLREDTEFEIPIAQTGQRKRKVRRVASPEPLPPGAESATDVPVPMEQIQAESQEEDEEEGKEKEIEDEEEDDDESEDGGDAISNELLDDPEVRKRLEEEDRIRREAAKKGKNN